MNGSHDRRSPVDLVMTLVIASIGLVILGQVLGQVLMQYMLYMIIAFVVIVVAWMVLRFISSRGRW